MQVHYNLDALPTFKNAVITIGTFDGVHYGHRSIIQQLIHTAQLINGESILITFEPHPRLITDTKAHQNLKLIHTLEEKINILSQLHIDHLVVAPFTIEFAEQTAEQYVADFLIRYFHPHTIIIGYDHHFGKNRTGNFKLLDTLKNTYNYNLIEITSAVIDNIAISSTQIRKLLNTGQVDKVAQLLLHNYTISGHVIHGKKLGRTIGFPTANIGINNTYKLIPCNGIYAVYVYVHNNTYKGVLNIGTNPTTDSDNAIKLEVFILDFNLDIYDASITIEFLRKIRDEKKFDSIDELKYWIEKDVALAQEIFDCY